ncbi:PRC-barrel domain-containing protein [Pelagibacterium xiamenense]|uniref:PRC-barrel domain-containing protein n=1 Tax=Pelagibacterium xiamenense TaxID=2901140 RepID=UPI001E4879AF|nr:PRC-barrel domain-containing protein [Pelagibacterium xiamenense]MCD7059807.1 PRC-barrel domain-containing protein [Pelagibacterium xiamenense]
MAQNDQPGNQNGADTSNKSVTVLENWSYEGLYSNGWSVDDFIWSGTVQGPNGDEIGNVENVIFSDDGEALALIAEVGGFWDIGDTHVSVPWDEVQVSADGQMATVPVTEDSVGDYAMFSDENWFSDEVFRQDSAQDVSEVDDDLEAGPNVFKANEFIGDYAYLPEEVPYGYVNDLIVGDGRIQSIVIDASSYNGAPGYYAYPYETQASWDPHSRGYAVPYGESEIQSLDTFDYDRLSASSS